MTDSSEKNLKSKTRYIQYLWIRKKDSRVDWMGLRSVLKVYIVKGMVMEKKYCFYGESRECVMKRRGMSALSLGKTGISRT